MINPKTLPKSKASEILIENLNAINSRKLSNKILSLIDTNTKTNKCIQSIKDTTIRNNLAELWLKETQKRIQTIKQYHPTIPPIIYSTTTSVITGRYRDILRMEN